VKALDPSVSSFILDGEMMAWDTKNMNFKQKGERNSFLRGEGLFFNVFFAGQNVDVKSLPSSGAVIPCFCAFDVLLFNGKVVTNLPLKERVPLLDRIFKDTSGVILKTPQWTAKNEYVKNIAYVDLYFTLNIFRAEVRESLNRAIDNRDEGIMMKDPNTVYRPSKERKGGWWKIKPEVLDLKSDL
jgi:DNA ligase 4